MEYMNSSTEKMKDNMDTDTKINLIKEDISKLLLISDELKRNVEKNHSLYNELNNALQGGLGFGDRGWLGRMGDNIEEVGKIILKQDKIEERLIVLTGTVTAAFNKYDDLKKTNDKLKDKVIILEQSDKSQANMEEHDRKKFGDMKSKWMFVGWVVTTIIGTYFLLTKKAH